MQDRYLFKAKRVDNGEWVIGNLIFSEDALDGWEAIIIPTTNSNMYASDKDDTNKGDIHFENWYRVDKDTVCRCTGLKDKNGKLIWENDIVFVSDADGCSGQMDTGVGKISFIEGLWYIEGRVQNGLYDIDKCFQIKVVGSEIDDNPELLEV